MKLDIYIKVSNDNCYTVFKFEADQLIVCDESPALIGMIDHAKEQFNQPVEQVDLRIIAKDI